MPEGDTIWRTAAALRQALAGERITAARPEGLSLLVGTTVSAVDPVGKHLVIRFDNGYALHSHMRMRGVWQVYRPGERWRRPAWQLKALLETSYAVAACFAAPEVQLVRNLAPLVGHLGPDILTDAWPVSEVVSRARELNTIPVGEVLLDQRVTAGIGNIYRCEALWQERINPWTKTADLSDEQLAQLFQNARAKMRANLHAASRRPAWIHGRRGRPCPRCATAIKSRLMGENPRVVYWCPSCQPGLAAE